jgi:YHS domain-containing protein
MKLAILAGVVVIGLGGTLVAQTEGHSHDKQTAATTQPVAKPVNTKCPVSGEPIDSTITVVQDGKVVAFCCKDCVADFKKDPAKYMGKLK